MQQVGDSISEPETTKPGISPIQTTLWELIKSINEEVEPEHDHLVSEIVSDILDKGRVRFLKESPLCRN